MMCVYIILNIFMLHWIQCVKVFTEFIQFDSNKSTTSPDRTPLFARCKTFKYFMRIRSENENGSLGGNSLSPSCGLR